MASYVFSRYENQSQHQQLVKEGYTPLKCKQVARYGEIYDKITYVKNLDAQEPDLLSVVRNLFPSFMVCHFQSFWIPLEEAKKKAYFLNKEATNQFFKEELGYNPRDKQSLANFLKRPDTSDQTRAFFGHSYFAKTYKME